MGDLVLYLSNKKTFIAFILQLLGKDDNLLLTEWGEITLESLSCWVWVLSHALYALVCCIWCVICIEEFINEWWLLLSLCFMNKKIYSYARLIYSPSVLIGSLSIYKRFCGSLTIWYFVQRLLQNKTIYSIYDDKP